MTEFFKTIKSFPNTQKGLELIVIKYSNESYRTQSEILQTAMNHGKSSEGALQILVGTMSMRLKNVNVKSLN